MSRLIAILGIAVLVGIAILLSSNRRKISWRLVGIGLTVQFLLGLFILKVPGTSDFFSLLAGGVNKLVEFAMHGAVAALGDTLTYGKFYTPESPHHEEFIFAIRIGFAIIFIMTLSALGYYFGILQRLVKLLSKFMTRFMGLSGPESLSCAAAAFVGQVECQALIKPYMPTLTRSELFTTMTCAMATISGTAMAAYLALFKFHAPDQISMLATQIIAASLMSAMGGIVLSKIFIPETETDKILKEAEMAVPIEGTSAMDAATHGVNIGIEIAVKVVVMVAIAIALMDMFNAGFESLVGLVGIHANLTDVVTYAYMPVAWMIGVPWHECQHVAHLMATELLYNEFVSYGQLAPVIGGAGAFTLAAKTQLIAVAALCGFAHPGSIAINIGGLGAMAPARRSEIAGLAFKAMMVANMATWITAAMCGILF